MSSIEQIRKNVAHHRIGCDGPSCLLLRRIDTLQQQVTDAETLLFNMYDRDVMTHEGTRDAWEGFHGAAEHIRASREASQ